MPSSTYDYGFAAGSGANREDIGGRRKRPSKRKADRDSMLIVRDTTKMQKPSEEAIKKMRQRELQRRKDTI